MNCQHGTVMDLPHAESPLIAGTSPKRESRDLPSSLVINPKEEQAAEAQFQLKEHKEVTKTRQDTLGVPSELLNAVSLSKDQPQAFYPGQQNMQKHQNRNIQSQKQKSQNLSHSPPQEIPPKQTTSDLHKSDNQNITLKINEKNKNFLPKKRKSQRKFSFEDDNSDNPESFKFPFINQYLKNHCSEYLKTLQIFDKAKEKLQKTCNNTFINCDVRYFNWKLFTEEVGKFQVVLIDPPWRIKGAQQNDSQFMFSNCRFSLEYNTMANSEIGRIPLHLLSDEGFIFLWILNSQLDASLEIMEQWGYQLVQEVVWVKLKDQKINLTHGYYFMHSYQVCLVGYKCKKGQQPKLKVRKGFTWNTIFAQVRQKSQKPEDIYAIIDIMFKSSNKIQIFARNHNLRFGIFSIGNELGESYDKWLLRLSCDQCGNTLCSGNKRFKAKSKPNYDLCESCITHKDRSQFFELANNVDENIKHQYISCDHCGSEPIWGLRFQCITCHDFDICQNCYDKNLHEQTNFHPKEHQFMFLEVPVFGNGFHIHESKCSSCYQNPIIGIYFTCTTCKNLNLCQKCYFQRPPSSFNGLMKRHKPEHQLEVIFESQIQQDKRYECFSCKREILQNCWMCENCYNFFFCEKCFDNRTEFKSLYANTHKKYHVLSKIF